jgi:hypothetical protein
MSIFVDAGKRFNLVLNCNVIRDDNNEDVKGRNFADMSNIIEEATIINSVTGNPLLRTSVLCKSIISNFFSVIRIKDGDNEETFYPDPHNVSMMRYELVKSLSKKWLELTGGK